jgi:negative regulator of flagellin synthesis FlgM
MQVNGPSQLHGAQTIAAPHMARSSQAGSVATAPSITDQLDISEAGRIAGQLSETSGIRQERVQAIRTAILNGTYESEQKLSVAVDRLLDEIG